jgi:hypothetical protein
LRPPGEQAGSGSRALPSAARWNWQPLVLVAVPCDQRGWSPQGRASDAPGPQVPAATGSAEGDRTGPTTLADGVALADGPGAAEGDNADPTDDGDAANGAQPISTTQTAASGRHRPALRRVGLGRSAALRLIQLDQLPERGRILRSLVGVSESNHARKTERVARGVIG